MLRALLSYITMIISLILIVPLLILLVPIWLFVSLCKSLNRLMVSTDTTWDKIIQFEPGLGWKPIPNLKKTEYYDEIGDKGSVTTGEEGWPGTYKIEDSEIVVFGDSFAFGFGSECSDTYYSNSNNLRIKPIAAPGYNMVQGLMLMKKYREKLNDKLIVWLICLENDLVENLAPYNGMKYTVPYLKKNKENKWEIEDSHVTKEKWLYGEKNSYTSLKFATICTSSEYSDRAFSACKYLIEEAKTVCDSVNSELVLFTIPDKRLLTQQGIIMLKRYLDNDSTFNKDYPDLCLGKICEELKVTHLPGLKYLEVNDYKVRDPHWNKMGNSKLSTILNDYFESNFSIKKD
ncbi:hypothetical protein BH23BAC3_BH23BAC3_24570 [soil metagenome]